MNKKSALTDNHKRIQRETVLKQRDNMDWKNSLFSNENSFNFDEPDDFNCYFHDLRKATDIRWMVF